MRWGSSEEAPDIFLCGASSFRFFCRYTQAVLRIFRTNFYRSEIESYTALNPSRLKSTRSAPIRARIATISSRSAPGRNHPS
jgi:hypothetical protein